MNRLGPQFAAIIEKQLKVKGWTQADLAREMGVTPKHINQMLTGKATGSPGMLDFVAFTLGFEWVVSASRGGRTPEDRTYRCSVCGQETIITRGDPDYPLPWPDSDGWVCWRSECRDNGAATDPAESPENGSGSQP